MADVKRLFIGNLPYSLATDDLRQLVAEIAPGSSADVVMDRMTGRSKGFGFITAPTSSAADILMARLNGRELAGRTVVVNEARPMEARASRRFFDSPSAAYPEPPPLELAVVETVAELDPSREVIGIVEAVGRDLVAYFSAHPEEMKRMPHRQFEELVAEIWARMGYEVELRQQTRDGGIDVIAMRRAEANLRFLIQCKRPEPHKKVSVETVRSLLGVKLDQGGSKAILATTVTFTRDAQQMLDQHRWELEGRDYDGLLDWLGRVPPGRHH